MTRLVGFTGYPYHGKTTAAQALHRVYGYQILSFASTLKKMVLQLEGVTEDHVYGDKKEEPIPACGGATARKLMETLGTKWGREMIDPDLWLIQNATKVRSILDAGGYVVFDDVRFPNEVQLIEDLGGVVLGIVRKEIDFDNSLPANQHIKSILEGLSIQKTIQNKPSSITRVDPTIDFSHAVLRHCSSCGVELNLHAKK
jgi:hypothetical protein